VSGRATRVVAGSILALAVAMTVVSVIVALTTFPRQQPREIVVVPAERTDEIRAAAGGLDPTRDCEGDVRTSPILGDAPKVYCELEVHGRSGTSFDSGWVNGVVGVVVGFLWLGTGMLTVSRQSRNTAGWIFIVIGFFFLAEWASLTFLVKGIKVDPGSVPLLGMWAVVNEYALVAIALLPLLFLLYPDGSPPTPRWRWAEWALFTGVTVAVLGIALDPGPLNNMVESGVVYLNPIGVPALAGTAGAVAAVGTIVALVASLSTVVAVRGRFKRSSGEERQQMRWLVFVATVAVVLFLTLAVGGIVVDRITERGEDIEVLGVNPFDALWIVLILVLTLGIPGAYLIAIFKHGLWNLDVVIKKTLVAFVLTLLLALVGLALVGALSVFAFGATTGVLVGLIAGVLAWPVVRYARATARRIVFGRRTDPYAVLTEFSGRVGETYAAEDVLPRMARLLGEGTGASSARVLLMIGSELEEGARWPEASTATGDEDLVPVTDRGEDLVPVTDRGEELGALAVTMPANDPMNPAKDKLVRDLASQAGLVLRNARLIEELRASRRRIVSSQDERARKLERDIHDGAQQQLVALGVKMRLLEPLVERDPTKAAELVGQLQTDTTDALENLRDLARGIYPPLLADRGLAAALEAQGRKVAVPVHLEPDGVGRYPREVESAVYFCVLEALQNAGKYAHANEVIVRLAERNGDLVFEIRDDGVGFDPDTARGGTGLRGMADRLEAVGGELALTSTPGRGTTIRGRVPVGAEG
jgi:signal transduction histidine kinase